MILISFFPVLLLTFSILGAQANEEEFSRRIHCHLTIDDNISALKEAKRALIHFPESIPLHESQIRVLAKLGDERQMLLSWDEYVQRFPDKALNRELIEDMAWGVLYKACDSSSIIMREMALLAAFFSQESKGITLLHQGMQDSNYAVRSTAVKLAGHFRDQKLIDEVKRLFREEKVWLVRKELIEAIGEMKIMELKNELESLIASDQSLEIEKTLAITSLLELLETINRPEVERLAYSNRSGLRQLASKSIAYFQSLRDLDLLLVLAQDYHSDVRSEAFQAIGQLRPKEQINTIIALAKKGVSDPNYKVALSAAWLLTLYLPQEGQQVFANFLQDNRRDVRVLAAAALAACGKYGLELTRKEFFQHYDPMVRLNLALGLIYQRHFVDEASNHIKEMVIHNQDKWNCFEVGIFRAIYNKPSSNSSESTSTPESENQLLRLEMLNLLAILHTSGVEQAIREYLLERSWEISATAAALLLSEGDESAVKILEQYLTDKISRVRIHAALILSIWSRDEKALQILEENYHKSEWESKAKILEALGRIGSIRSTSFLISVLKEPSQTLRLIAAMALIQCLNH